MAEGSITPESVASSPPPEATPVEASPTAPPVAEATAELPHDSEEHAERNKPTAERAAEAADSVFKKKHGEILTQIRQEGRDATDDEADLLMVGNYAKGFSSHNYEEGNLPVDGLVIKNEAGVDVKVNALTAQKVNADGSVSYMYEAKSTDGGDTTVTGEVSGVDMATVQLEQHKDGILKNFTDESEKKLIEWQANGAKAEEIPLTNDELNALAPQAETEKLNDSLTRIDEALDLRVGDLNVKIAELSSVENRTSDQQQELTKAQQMREYIAAAKTLKGPLGVIARDAAITKALAHGEGEVGKLSLTRLARMKREEIGTAKDRASENFVKALEEAGLPQDQIGDAKALIGSQQKMSEFLTGETKDPKVQALLENKAVAEAFLDGTTELDIDNFLAKSEVVLTEDQKAKVELAKRLAKGGLITAGGLAMLLLAITGVTMSFVAKGMSDSRAA